MTPEQYRDIVDAVGHGVLVYDRSLVVTLVNERALELYDAEAAGLQVGMPFETFARFHAQNGGFGGEGSVDERVAARMDRARTFTPYRAEGTLFNGRVVMAEGRTAGTDHFVITYTDITPLRRAEEAVRVAHSRYAQLFESTNEGWWFIEPDGTTIDVNPALCAILGRPRDEIICSTVFDVVDDENRKVFEEQLRRRRLGITEPYEITLLRPDGSGVTCINSPAPIYDDQGTHVGSIGLWTDISELKRANRELVEAEQRAQAASRAKSEFLSTMSHELRTPLNAILGFAELLEGDIDDPLSARQHESVGYIAAAGRHLLDLITDVLDLARIESGSIGLEFEVVSFGSVVAECIRLVEGVAARREVNIAANDIEGVVVVADRIRLRQAVVNLLSNAVKYNTVGGSVTITAMGPTEGMWRITVADTGPGIAPDLAPQLFEPFNRLGAERGEVEGTGIGLSITKQIVELMGGEIGLDTEPGRGSRFWIDLPAG